MCGDSHEYRSGLDRMVVLCRACYLDDVKKALKFIAKVRRERALERRIDSGNNSFVFEIQRGSLQNQPQRTEL